MSAKAKYPRADAMAVAEELVAALTFVTTRIAIAGSLRRMKREVGDVELVYVPVYRDVPADLFGATVSQDQAAAKIQSLRTAGILDKRVGTEGGTSWGPKNKLAVHCATGIPVDLFSTEEDCWFNYLVCRTGSAEHNKRIAIAAQQKGWKWNPYGPGFSRLYDTETVAVASEEEVFAFVGLPYLRPELR